MFREAGKSGIRMMIDVELPESGKCDYPAPLSIEDRVRNALELVDSGYDSYVNWLMVNKLYTALKKCKPSKRVQNLINMIEPIMQKYGYYNVPTSSK